MKTIVTIAATAALAFALTACGGGDDLPAQGPELASPAVSAPVATSDNAAPVAEPESEGLPVPNPVLIAKKVPGCELTPGSEVGTTGMVPGAAKSTLCTIRGNDADPDVYYAGSEATVWVHTYDHAPEPGDIGERTDFESTIVGPQFVIKVGGLEADKFDVTLAQITSAVGGKAAS